SKWTTRSSPPGPSAGPRGKTAGPAERPSSSSTSCSAPDPSSSSVTMSFVGRPALGEGYAPGGSFVERAGSEPNQPGLPRELRAAIDADAELKDALRRTGLPIDFQAMVLGLAAF